MKITYETFPCICDFHVYRNDVRITREGKALPTLEAASALIQAEAKKDEAAAKRLGMVVDTTREEFQIYDATHVRLKVVEVR
jgi:fumarylacetoacetate (FAA) hydrolase family protein